MKDFTQGPIRQHLLSTASPIAIGMIFQGLYYLVDLYFVGALGDTALAGVSAAGIIMFVAMGLTQMLTVGAVALISHAVGRKDTQDANLIFNQSVFLGAVSVVLTLLIGYTVSDAYMNAIAADEATKAAGKEYIYWFLPGLALQFIIAVLSAGLRGIGVVKPAMIVQMLSIIMNTILAPVMIAGWGTGYAMGVAGAALSTSISVLFGVIVLSWYFHKQHHYINFDLQQCKPKSDTLKRMLSIGLPAGGEFVMMFVLMSVFYWVLQGYGSEAQAAFGLGSRILQSVFLPGLAIAFAVTTVAGQNFGAKSFERVRQTFTQASVMITGFMVLLMLICQFSPEVFIRPFTDDPEVLAISSVFLRIISINFIASGLIFTCSGMFQALGNTVPALLSTMSRLITFAIPAAILRDMPDIALSTIWYLGVTSVAIQATISLLLLRKEMRKRLVDITDTQLLAKQAKPQT